MKCASFTEVTFDPNLATMTFCNGLDNCESEPRAALRECLTIRTAIKLFKQARQVTLWNTNSTVLYCKSQCRRRCLKLDCNLSTLWCVFECIFHKVIDSLI